MSILALDTPEVIDLAKAQDLYAAGYRAVLIYLRADRAPQSSIDAIHKVGMKVGSIWEKGDPAEPGYFTAEQGLADAKAATSYASNVGQPSKTTISAAVDYDSVYGDVADYLEEFHDWIKTYGYHSLPYGNGETLQSAVDAGIAVGGYLSQSTGFRGYDAFKPKAAIVQRSAPSVCGLNADPDEIAIPVIQIAGLTIDVLW
jgi:hypothetical protein